jgi:hypothetical protein
MWAIKSAHEGGLSIRQIASATDLSASRVHQVITAKDCSAGAQPSKCSVRLLTLILFFGTGACCGRPIAHTTLGGNPSKKFPYGQNIQLR